MFLLYMDPKMFLYIHIIKLPIPGTPISISWSKRVERETPKFDLLRNGALADIQQLDFLMGWMEDENSAIR